MADHNDAALIVSLAQWGSSMGIEESQKLLWSDDFDPETVDPRDPRISRMLNWNETIGTLTKNGLLDTALVLDWVWVSGMWERLAPAVQKIRAGLGSDELYENFEALARQQQG